MEDDSTETFSFTSFAEYYDQSGKLVKQIGKPLVYSIVNRIAPDSILVSAFFFALNKTYNRIEVSTSTGFSNKILLQDDTLFSNTKSAVFKFEFHKKEDIKIFIRADWLQDCPTQSKTLIDTISLEYKNGRIINGG